MENMYYVNVIVPYVSVSIHVLKKRSNSSAVSTYIFFNINITFNLIFMKLK